jgi:3-dehydroquinate synthase
METISIKLKPKKREVKIYSGTDAFIKASRLVNNVYIKKVVISNPTVWNKWEGYFKEHIKNFTLFLMPDGERFKNYKTVHKIYDFLVSISATRKSLIIAFGGGVIGDIAGFVASTYHRGIPIIHIPTTLLAQVDSSIGGKTGYNLKEGKNLIGSFYQPEFIISDPLFLDTLPQKEFLSGFAEVIKAGCIKDNKLFCLIEKNLEKVIRRDKHVLSNIITKAQKVKINVVQKDEREEGLRAILNFGHTLGHAIEVQKKWRVSHGFAVAAGIAFASFLSYKESGLSEEELLRILKLLKKVGYSLNYNLDKTQLGNVLLKDKKKKEETVEWVLLERIGKAIYGIKIDIEQIVHRIVEFENYLKHRKNFIS